MRALLGGTAMLIRQVAVVAEDLVEADSALKALLGVTHAYTDPGVGEFGLHNTVLATGRSFVEVVSPSPAQDSSIPTAAGRMLERRGGDCGYMVLFQVENLAPVRARVEAAGIRIIWETERTEVSAFHVHPKDVGGAIVSFDEMRPADDWVWAGPEWQAHRAAKTGDLRSCLIEVDDPMVTAAVWAGLLGTQVKYRDAIAVITMDDGAEVQFSKSADQPPRGLIGFSLASLFPEPSITTAVQVCGVQISIVAD
jgi:hypothetical protein